MTAKSVERKTCRAAVLALGLLSGSMAGQEKYLLAFKPKVDQTLIYNLDTRMDSEGKSFLGQSLSLGARALGRIDLDIRQAATDRVFAELRTPGINVTLQSPGRQNEFALATPFDRPVEIVFDRSMRIRELKNVEALEKQNPLNFSILDIFRNYLPTFPDAPVGRGETWLDHKKMLIPFEGMDVVIAIDITFALDDVVLSGEGRLAFISASYVVNLSGSRNVEAYAAGFEGKGTGSGKLSCLLDEGTFTDYRLDYTVDGSMVLRKEGASVASWPFSLSMASQVNLVGRTPR
jgi:hypothetical protein